MEWGKIVSYEGLWRNLTSTAQSQNCTVLSLNWVSMKPWCQDEEIEEKCHWQRQTQLTAPEQREEKGMLKPLGSLRYAIPVSKAEGKNPTKCIENSLTNQWQR